GGTLTVEGAAGDGQVNLTVTDTGPGVPEEIRASIFDAFFTTRPHGTGVGLFISQQILRRHGGELVLGASASGASFRLALPFVPVPAAAVDSVSRRQASPHFARAGQPPSDPARASR